MTRVLQVLGRSAGGIARHVSQITAALDETDDLHVDIAGPVGLPIAMPKPVLPVDIPDGPVAGHRRAVVALSKLLAGYDVVHAHGLRAGIDAGLAARRTDKTSLVTVHNLVRTEISGIKAVLYRRAEAAAVLATGHTFAVSHDIARHLRHSVPRHADKIEVLYVGIGDAPPTVRSRAEVRASMGLADDTRLIVSVARLAPQKSLDVLLDAVALLQSDASVAVLGEGPLRMDLERRARSLGLGGRVSFLGFRPDVADHIAAADAFSLSSLWEGVPLAAQEAILLGTPVVGTDVGGMRELISNKVSGRLVPPGDPVALAAALDEVLSSPERAAAYARAARDGLHERFSTDAMLERLREAYAS
jgi:glycosyltransferase involved in cell wall biosynthesis